MLKKIIGILLCILPLVSISMEKEALLTNLVAEDVTLAFLDEKLKDLPVEASSLAEENQKTSEQSKPILKQIELKINEITEKNLYDADKDVFDAEKCMLLIKMSEYINAAFKFEPKVHGRFLNTRFYVPYLRSKKTALLFSNSGTYDPFLIPVKGLKIIEKSIVVDAHNNQDVVRSPPDIHPYKYFSKLSTKELKVVLTVIFSLDKWIQYVGRSSKAAAKFYSDNKKQELIKYTLSLIARPNNTVKKNGNLLMKFSTLLTVFKNYYPGSPSEFGSKINDADYLDGKNPVVTTFMQHINPNVDPKPEYNYGKDFVLIFSEGFYFLVPTLFITGIQQNEKAEKNWIKSANDVAWTKVYCMYATRSSIEIVLKKWYKKKSIDLSFFERDEEKSIDKPNVDQSVEKPVEQDEEQLISKLNVDPYFERPADRDKESSINLDSAFEKAARKERFSYWNPVSWLEYFFPNTRFKNPPKVSP